MIEKTHKIEMAPTLFSVYFKKTITTIIYTILWIPVYIYRCILVEYVKNYKPNYGRIVNHLESAMEENLYIDNPKVSLVFTLVLEKHLELERLCQLFTDNIIEAKLANKKSQDILRYPQFRQYLTEFGGYKFWKNDDNFNLSNHIKEQQFNTDFSKESKIHQIMTNKKFAPNRSPWELILVNNYMHDPEKSLIIFRTHHFMADAKSCIKLIVERLGEKSLKTPIVQFKNDSFYHNVKYYLLLPFYFVHVQVFNHFANLKSEYCPWKWKSENEHGLVNLAISNEIPLNDIKLIAKRNNVTTSAVIMAAVAGGIAKSDERLAKTNWPTKWIMPKPNHPDVLANHAYSAAMYLPTDISSPTERLKKCNEIFFELKNSNHYVYEKSILFQLGTWFNPWRIKMTRNRVYPIVITNIAGDSEGFSVGSSPCSSLFMTCGPIPGAFGLIIGTFSYKNQVKLWISAKDELLSELQTKQLTDHIEKEFYILKSNAQ